MSNDTQPRAIVIDDEQLWRDALTAHLRAAGCEVVGVAENGPDGLELFNKEQPDIVVTDYHMPGDVNGDMVLGLILTSNPKTCVVVATNARSEELMIQLLDQGALGYFSKDTPPPDMRDGLSKIIERYTSRDN